MHRDHTPSITTPQCRIADQRGIVLVIAMLLITVLSIIGIAANRNAITDTAITSNYYASAKAFYAAEAGAEYGFMKLRVALRPLAPNLSIPSPTVPGYSFSTYSFTCEGSCGYVVSVLSGTYAGLSAYSKNYRIKSYVRDDTTSAVGKIELVVEDQLIPLFQFGIFYQADLELIPGANMTFGGGDIHSNHNIYFSSDGGATLDIASRVTSASNIYHQGKDRPALIGNVNIKDAGGTYQSMNMDSASAGWAADSQTRWGGQVKTQEHGVYELNMPALAGPIDILTTGTGSMYQKSGLRIVNGTAKDKNGNTVALTVGTISTTTFYDAREKKTVHVTDVDLQKLQASSSAMNALANPPAGEDPNILYVSSAAAPGELNAVRIVNGSSIPTSGLSVVSQNPVYVKGDYNTANRPAAIYGDALTVLSNSWDDSTDGKSTSGLDTRVASNTTVNAAVMAGNKNTAGSQYSGGAENFMRFLESWSGKTLTYSGSLTCLWESQQATGNWSAPGSYYRAPTRSWSYGIDMNNLPPGTPRVRDVRKLIWRQVAN